MFLARACLAAGLLGFGCERGAGPSGASVGASAASGTAPARAPSAAPPASTSAAPVASAAPIPPAARTGPIRPEELAATPELRPPSAHACRLEGDPRRPIELRATAASSPFARVRGKLTVTLVRGDADAVVTFERPGVRLHGLAPRLGAARPQQDAAGTPPPAGAAALWLHLTRAFELGAWWPGPTSRVSWSGGGTGSVTVVPAAPFSAEYRGGDVPCDALALVPATFARKLPRGRGQLALGTRTRLSLEADPASPHVVLDPALDGARATVLEERGTRRRVLVPWAGGHLVGWIDLPGLQGSLGLGSLGTVGTGTGGHGWAEPPTRFECANDLPLYARTTGDADARTSHVQVGTLLAGTTFESRLSPFMVEVRGLPEGVTPLALEVPGPDLFRCRKGRAR